MKSVSGVSAPAAVEGLMKYSVVSEPRVQVAVVQSLIVSFMVVKSFVIIGCPILVLT